MLRRSRTAAARSFDLLRWFSVLSLLCILLIGAGSAYVLSRFVGETMLQRDAVVTQEFIDSLMQNAGVPTYFNGGAPGADLQRLFDGIAGMPDVVRANVYSRAGIVLWSTHAPFIGERTGPNRELERVLAGALQVEAGAVGDEKEEHVSFEGHAKGSPFIEVYVPVRGEPGGAVVGAVELYKMPRPLFAAIRRGSELVWATSAAGALLLYATLLGVVLRASRVMRQQQAQLVAGERMSALGEMAGTVAHAVRNPLASIRSSAELIGGADPQVTAECAGDIIREADRLDAWVSDFLVQERRADAAGQPVDINAMIADSLQGFAPALQRQAIEVEVDPGKGLPPVKGSPTSLGHIFGSLVANALEAMPRGGRLVVRSRLDRRHGAVEIRIDDTGGGLPREAGRASASPMTTKPRGLGVGLMLARQVVARHGGTLDLSSAKGRGTTVMIRLPGAA